MGAFAVFLTLAYLTIQVRQNSKLLRATIREQRTDASHRIIQWSAEFRDADGAHDLLCHAMFRDWDTYIRQQADGLIDDAEWQSQLLIWDVVVKDPRVAKVWRDYNYGYSKKLREIIDPLVEQVNEGEFIK